MSFGQEESKLLNLWQRLHFRSEANESSPSEKADAIRSQVAQIQHLQRSGELSSVGYCSLFSQYAGNYSTLVDEQEASKGLNNFAEPVLTLVSGQKNESQAWKSSLSLESLKTTPTWQKLLEKTQSTEAKSKSRTSEAPLNANATNNSKEESHSAHSEVKYKLPKEAVSSNWKSAGLVSHNEGTSQQGIEAKRPVQVQPGHSKGLPFVQEGRMNPGNQRPDPQVEDNTRIPNKRKAFSSYPKGVFSHDGHNSSNNENDDNQRPWTNPAKNSRTNLYGNSRGEDSSHRSGSTRQNPGQKPFVKTYNRNNNNNNGYEEEDDSTAPQSFITAKQQYIIECKTKKQRGGGRGGPSRGGYARQGVGGYGGGGARRTLGTRRGPSSQFVPPILNRDGDDGGMPESNTYGCSSVRKGDNKKPAESITGDPELDEKLKHIEPKMVELIMSEIMDHGPPVTWDDIAGLEFAKNVIKEIVVWPMLRPDIFKGLRGPPKGLLLFGPPGTGKTLIGKCIASQSKATFFSISASSLTSKWVGEGEKMVRALFAVARCYLPAVIFIDEIDSLLTQRTDGEHDASRRIKTEFLVQLDGAATTSDERLLVVGATNRPQEIDEAARRRLVKRLYIPLPEDGARSQIIRNLLVQQTYSLTEGEIDKIVQRTGGYSGSDMSNLCREAALGPIRSIGSADIQNINADQVRPILFCDFDAALSQVRASVSQQDLEVYTEWNRLFGSGSK